MNGRDPHLSHLKTTAVSVIADILKNQKRYAFFSKIDVLMQYNTFKLDDKINNLFTVVTSFGKFRYNRSPIGLECSPNTTQQVMNDILMSQKTPTYRLEPKTLKQLKDVVGATNYYRGMWPHRLHIMATLG